MPNKVGAVEKVLLALAVVLITLYATLPLIWVIICSLTDEIDLIKFSSNLEIPSGLSFNHFYAILTGVESEYAFKSLTNSLIIACSTTFISATIGSLGGYALARLMFPGRGKILFAIIVFQTLPALVMLIPLYVMVRSLGLLDTLIGVILVEVGFNAPYVAWLLIGFLQGIPMDIEDAALTDGCNRVQALIRVLLPLIMPGVLAVSIFTFLISWGDLLIPLILTSTNATTLPLVIAQGLGEYYARYGFMSALSVVAIIPPTILIIVFQKYIIKGLTMGGVKG
jgi:multiple sugar transport system permease protein